MERSLSREERLLFHPLFRLLVFLCRLFGRRRKPSANGLAAHQPRRRFRLRRPSGLGWAPRPDRSPPSRLARSSRNSASAFSTCHAKWVPTLRPSITTLSQSARSRDRRVMETAKMAAAHKSQGAALMPALRQDQADHDQRHQRRQIEQAAVQARLDALQPAPGKPMEPSPHRTCMVIATIAVKPITSTMCQAGRTPRKRLRAKPK